MPRPKMHPTATGPPKEGRTLDVVAQHRGITHRTALSDSGALALRCDPARVVADKEAGGGYGPAPRMAPALPVDAGDVRAVRAVTTDGLLLAIDPGNHESAWLTYDTVTRRAARWAKDPNVEVLEVLRETAANALSIEMVASYGMAVGADVFETVLWIGRYVDRWAILRGHEPRLVYRRDVKLHLCGSARAKDPNVRQALIDRYGPGKETAIGRKAAPGPLYGIAGDCWSALAVAITAAEIGSGIPMPAAKMTVDQAARVLGDAAGLRPPLDPVKLLVGSRSRITDAYRLATKLYHPDKGGDPAAFRKITEARDALLEHLA